MPVFELFIAMKPEWQKSSNGNKMKSYARVHGFFPAFLKSSEYLTELDRHHSRCMLG
jgi:hypothetical protein